MRIAICFLLCLCGCEIACCQGRYFFQHVTAEDGLLSNLKLSIYQDGEGYYWFNSAQTLQRFDGKNFVTYRYAFRRRKDFSDNSAPKPIEDRQGNIWTWTGEGIQILRKNRARLERLYLADAADSNISNICNLQRDENGRVWIITSRNIFVCEDAGSRPVRVYQGADDFMHAVYDRGRNGLWIVLNEAPHAFRFFDCGKREMSRPAALSIDGLFGSYNPLSLFSFDADNNLWIGDYKGDLCRYDLKKLQPQFFDVLYSRHWGRTKLPNSAVMDLADDGHSIVFSADNYSGLLLYSREAGGFTAIPNENNNPNGLHFENECNNMVVDREKNVWVNTDMGLNIFNPGRQCFHYLSESDGVQNTPFSHDVTSFLQTANKDLWISTWGGGIFRYDSTFRLLKNYIHRENDRYSLGEPFSETWSLAEDPGGRIVVGCQHAMLSILDPGTGKFENRLVDAFNKQTITLLAEDKQHNFWFGLNNGNLGKWEAGSGVFSIRDGLYGKDEKAGHAVDGLFVDGSGTVWCAAGDDAVKYARSGGEQGFEAVIRGIHPLALSGVGDSLILGGSFGSGLFVYDRRTRTSKFFTTDNGLSSNIVYSALADGQNNFWVFTNQSIERLNPATGKVTKFGPEDGIRDQVFQRAAYKLKNGVLLVATNSGVVYFDPARIRADPPPYPVAITGVRIGLPAFPVDSLLQAGGIDIPFGKSPVAIDYASLSFADRSNLDYFYKLEGADTGWVAAGMARSVLYANIAPGHYRFEVKCRNRDGAMSAVTTMAIVIRPPWWRSWWGYLLWVILAGAIVLAVYRYHRRTDRRLADIREKIAADLHDDIGSTLNSISVYSVVVSQQLEGNKANAIEILEKMGSASRGMIDNMNDIVWAINPDNDVFENVIQRMQYFAAELLSGKSMLLHFEIDEKAKRARLSMERRKNFYLIFKEAVTNAYKYSHARNVRVRIGLEGKGLKMVIEDDGCGFDPAAKNGSGNGLRNMRSRAKEVGAEFGITSAAGQGTVIALMMAVKG